MEIKTFRCRRCGQYGQHYRTVSRLDPSRLSLLQSFYSLRRDYTEFLEDLEEDPVLRQNVNVYKGKLILLLLANELFSLSFR